MNTEDLENQELQDGSVELSVSPIFEDDQPKVVGLRERLIARGKKLFPEDYTEDEYDDDVYDKIANRVLDDMDERDERLEKLSSGSKKLFNIFNDNPETFEVFSKLREGVELPDALLEVYGEEAMQPNKGGDFWKKFRENKESQRKKDDDVRKNIEASDRERSAYYAEAGMSEEEIANFEAAESALYEAMSQGKLDKKYYTMLRKALNHDDDVKAAHRQGEVDTKNAKIKNELRRSVGDGLPHFDGEGGSSEPKQDEQESKAKSLFAELAARSQRSKLDY